AQAPAAAGRPRPTARQTPDQLLKRGAHIDRLKRCALGTLTLHARALPNPGPDRCGSHHRALNTGPRYVAPFALRQQIVVATRLDVAPTATSDRHESLHAEHPSREV